QRAQLQMSDLKDVVCVYDQAREGLWNSLQRNIYGALPAGVASSLGPCEGGMLFSPTDSKDHLSSSYVDLIPCRAGTIRCLTLSLSHPSVADRGKVSVTLQRDGFATLATSVDEQGKPMDKVGPIVVPEDARQF